MEVLSMLHGGMGDYEKAQNSTSRLLVAQNLTQLFFCFCIFRAAQIIRRRLSVLLLEASRSAFCAFFFLWAKIKQQISVCLDCSNDVTTFIKI